MNKTADDLAMEAYHVLSTALLAHNASEVYALFSGGYDSLTATHLISQDPAFKGVIFVDTGIGIPETKQYVIDTCAAFGWELHILKGAWSYLQLLVRYGFPGPASHGYMYRYLKERPLMEFIQQRKTVIKLRMAEAGEKIPKNGPIIALAGGMRLTESDRRMGHVEPSHKEGAVLWVAPIYNWDGTDVTVYRQHYKLPRNAVKDNLHISGECLCGSFAKPNERRLIKFFYPAVDALLTAIEAVIALVAQLPISDIDKEHRTWGWKAYQAPDSQQDFFSLCYHCRADDQEPVFTEVTK